ncbi:MAG: dihydrofolate reductase family protein [Frankiaceae bacterium]|nr:dihydrofolate reductase family protein [Frankiaceae bacterium]
MRKIIVQLSVSLDGYFEGPERDISWGMITDEIHRDVNDFVRREIGTFLHGRVMHELMVNYWPTADQEPDITEPERDFAGIYREIPKIVYSSTYDDTAWNTSIVREVDPDAVRALKDQPGGDLGLGGVDLMQSFLEYDLVDEWRFYVTPVVLGAGRRVFPDGVSIPLRLTETRAFDNGVLLTRYARRA